MKLIFFSVLLFAWALPDTCYEPLTKQQHLASLEIFLTHSNASEATHNALTELLGGTSFTSVLSVGCQRWFGASNYTCVEQSTHKTEARYDMVWFGHSTHTEFRDFAWGVLTAAKHGGLVCGVRSTRKDQIQQLSSQFEILSVRPKDELARFDSEGWRKMVMTHEFGATFHFPREQSVAEVMSFLARVNVLDLSPADAAWVSFACASAPPILQQHLRLTCFRSTPKVRRQFRRTRDLLRVQQWFQQRIPP